MKILVTGSNGYIGSAVSDYLEMQSHQVHRLNRSVCDLVDKEQVNRYFENFMCDVVIHTAVAGGTRLKKETQNIVPDNLDMFCNLLRNRSKYKKFIHFGSGAQEKSTSYYGASKKAIAAIIDQLDSFYNVKIYGLFDENEIDTRFIKANVRRALDGKDIIVHKNKRMDFFHMKDLLTLIDFYINNKSLVKNLDCSYKTSLTLVEIAGIIKESCNPKIDIKIEQDGYENYWGKNTNYLNSIIGSDITPRLLETIKALKDMETK
jgi:nucleoside-diphosphate-sugar epimerase